MRVVKEKNEISTIVSNAKKAGGGAGFVPTMGALHQGHLSLVEAAYRHCDLVVVSVFVNPAQFDNPEDLKKYPLSLKNDVELLKNNFPETIVFAPSVEEIYGRTISIQHFDFGPLETKMEGKYRTGHFDGVGTVLKLFFDIVKPDKVFFGEKDYQQLQIVKKLVQITGQPVQIIACPISREPNGLARSSRNERLTPAEREQAAFIHTTLQQAKIYFGTKNATFVTEWVRRQFAENQALALEYFEIAEAETLRTVQQKIKGRSHRAFVAAYLRDVRLIDNLALD